MKSFTKALAVDEAVHGVRVNSISPGNVFTPLWQRRSTPRPIRRPCRADGEAAQWAGRMGTPEEVGRLCLFLASDATFTTGVDHIISGGAEIGYGRKAVGRSHDDNPVPARHLAGVVFDIDGTLLDNMPFHIEAFEAFTAAHGLPALTLEMRKWMDGRRNSDIFPRLFERAMTEPEIESLSDEKESAYRRLSAGRLEPLSGLMRLLDALDAAGVPIARRPRRRATTSCTRCASWAWPSGWRSSRAATKWRTASRSRTSSSKRPASWASTPSRLRRVRGRADGRGRRRPAPG